MEGFYTMPGSCPAIFGHPCLQAPYFDKYFDLSFPVLAVINEFNIQKHMQKMLLNNPTWNEYQQANCLYWQAGARNVLDRKIDHVLKQDRFKRYEAKIVPEAMGVNITETLHNIGIDLEWPPRKIARQVALLGIRRI